MASGIGSCILPKSATNLKVPGVRYRLLEDTPSLTVDLSVNYRADDNSPLLQRFLDVVTDTQRRELGARSLQATNW